MNVGLFALLAGFLMPATLVIRSAALLLAERQRGWSHPLNLLLWSWLLLAGVPVIALSPTVWSVLSGRSIEAGAMLLDFNATRTGLAKVAVTIAGVLLADAGFPRLYEQLTRAPISRARPTPLYLMRDLGVVAVCLIVALAAAFDR